MRVRYDCDTVTGECTMGEYSIWDKSVRDEHWKISSSPVPSQQRSNQDTHMALGYLTDAWCKYIYTALWMGWNLYFWLWRVRQVKKENAARMQRAVVLNGGDGWQMADKLPKPPTWDDEQPSNSNVHNDAAAADAAAAAAAAAADDDDDGQEEENHRT
jgi:hypothetical protein